MITLTERKKEIKKERKRVTERDRQRESKRKRIGKRKKERNYKNSSTTSTDLTAQLNKCAESACKRMFMPFLLRWYVNEYSINVLCFGVKKEPKKCFRHCDIYR